MRDLRQFIEGRWTESSGWSEVRSPMTGETVARRREATPEQMERALAAAAAAFRDFRRVSRHARSRLLAAMARRIAERRADLTAAIVAESGKPVTLAEAEVGRAVITFTAASEEVKRLGGEVVPVDVEAGGRAYAPATVAFVPRGPVLAIAPFNFPLNLIAHKVAPALAAGASVLVKPPPQAPGAACILAEIFEEAAKEASDAKETIPAAALQVIHGPNEVASLAVSDPRIATLSFTGSDKVGWALQKLAARKKVLLELGGDAAVVVAQDADLARAAARCAFGGYAYAGQVCISVQRVFLQKEIAARFTELFLAEVRGLRVGDPSRADTLVGPLIDAAAADRVTAWIEESVRGGAKLLAGGRRQGNVVEPTVLSGTKPTDKVSCEEVFGPVVVLETYDDFADALAGVNRSRFGLQAGLFTDSAARIRRASEELEVGGLVINDVPTFRSDVLPYGGVKDSGLGREGVRYAIEEYCERRVVVSWRGA